MNFSDVMREESKWTKTENGADAIRRFRFEVNV